MPYTARLSSRPMPTASRHQRATLLEIICALALFALFVGIEVCGFAGKVVFTRPLWIDETMTQSFASAPGIQYILTALKHGAETHLPTAFILMRWFSIPFGSPTPFALRLFACASMTLGVTGAYTTLRLSFPRSAALVGTLAIWSHHLVLRHAFDARFYGPMLAGSTWFAYFLVCSRHSPRPGLCRISAAVVAMLLFTVHYFGCSEQDW